MDRIEKCVELFLTRNYSFKTPLILALSGGVDSSVLASVLIDFKKKRGFDLRVLHIDHSWRGESLSQALSLQEKFEKIKIPFHLFTLSPPSEKRNLEESAREERLAIYQKMAKEVGAEAVLLGHHQDDLSETMLKRIFEGSSFPFWNAIEEVTPYNEIALWRPLLGFAKKQIIEYSEQHKIEYLIDSTQNDQRFLRNRMRNRLIPDLEDSFGKSLGTSLARLREQSQKLRDYMINKTEFLNELLEKNERGFLLDLRKSSPILYEYEIEFFLTDLCRRERLILSTDQKQRIGALLVEGDKEGLFKTANLTVKVRGKRVYFELPRNQKEDQIEEINQISMS